MKKVLLTLLAIALCFSLALPVLAQEPSETGDSVEIKSYLQDKIAPVVAGVLTSVLALISTLSSISKSLGALKDTKSSFTAEAKERAESFDVSTKMLKAQVEEIKKTIEAVPFLEGELVQLKEEVESLIEQCYTLAEILTLGFSANGEIIKSGKGHKMSVLLENAKCKMQNAKLINSVLGNEEGDFYETN